MRPEEPPLDPERPIIDPHLHLWDVRPTPGALQAPQRFLLPELLETVESSGHRVTHTVFVECHAMYRTDGPPELRPLGETEFVNGVAAMSASGEVWAAMASLAPSEDSSGRGSRVVPPTVRSPLSRRLAV